jgi:hypothetical protein
LYGSLVLALLEINELFTGFARGQRQEQQDKKQQALKGAEQHKKK